ncbi:hypothetical protein L6R50_01930 [Myxococcota bacterium]|nr:hypothetical protein [Myxococcota bacterium]
MPPRERSQGRRAPAGVCALAAVAALAVAWGCGGAEAPAGRPSLIAQAEKVRRERAPPKYKKKEGLHVDVPYLAGREFASIDPQDIEEQLGPQRERAVLPDGQVVVRYEKAEIRLWRGRIFHIRYPFAAPMDRKTAYGVCGFPLDLGPAIEASKEVRVNNAWGMRRISLRRIAADAPQFDQIEVWKFEPKRRPADAFNPRGG